jgi:rubrerythrin
MSEEQDKLKKVLVMALQMESDGKEFYFRMSQQSVNNGGRELFHRLTDEEDIHRKNFQDIYDVISHEKSWPDTKVKNHSGSLDTVFSQAIDEIDKEIAAPQTEFDAIDLAIEMEIKSINFYQDQMKGAKYNKERQFYQALVAEEQKHKQALLDYKRYISDPAGWLVSKTNPAAGSSYLPNSSGIFSNIEW